MQSQDLLLSLYSCVLSSWHSYNDLINPIHFTHTHTHTHTHTCTHSNSCLSSSQKVIWPWNHSNTSATKQTPIRTHAYQSAGSVNQALLSTIIMFYWTLSQYLVGLLGPFNSVTCVHRAHLERCWFYLVKPFKSEI